VAAKLNESLGLLVRVLKSDNIFAQLHWHKAAKKSNYDARGLFRDEELSCDLVGFPMASGVETPEWSGPSGMAEAML